MSKKLISIILTIAVILCQGTLCLGTVYAADLSDIDPDRPSDITDDNIIWSVEFKSESDLSYFPATSNVQREIAYDEYMQYTTAKPYINTNGNINGHYTDTTFSPAVDANQISRLQIRMKVVNAKYDGTITGKKSSGEEVTKELVPPQLQLYFAGVNDDGSSFIMNGSHSYSDSSKYDMHTDSNGNVCTDWFTYDINLDNISSWVAAKEITKMRFDVLNNCEGVALVDYIRLIGPKVPAIESIRYNSGTKVDEELGFPVNAENVEIYLTDPINSVNNSGVVFEDEFGNDVLLKDDVSLDLSGKIITLVLDQELSENTRYYIGINENVKITSQMSVPAPITTELETKTYRALSQIEIIDPNRPSDELTEDVVKSWDFKTAADIAYFPSLKNGNYVTEHLYGEYMQVTFGTPTKNANGNWAGHYTDTDLKAEPLNADVVTHMQVRMKVINETFEHIDPMLRFYFAGIKEDGHTFAMSSSTGVLSDPFDMITDENGNYCTEWMVVTLDLSKLQAWADAKTITSIRVNVMENCSGVALVDYIRFLGASSELESAAYTDANGTTDITDGTLVPANANSFTVKLTAPVASLTKEQVSLKSEYGTETTIESASLDKTGKIITVKISGTLEKSAQYTLTANPVLSGVMYVAEPITVIFDTERDLLNAKVTKAADGKSATVEYTNATDEDAVLVAIATSWKQVQQPTEEDGKVVLVDVPGRVEYLGKNMTVNSIAAGGTASAYLTFDVDADKSEFVEIVIWKYDTDTGEYTVFSKKVN